MSDLKEHYTALKFNNSTKGQKTAEKVLQKQCVRLLEWAKNTYVHVANEGKRSKIANIELKRQGMQKGFPDICVFDLKLVVELKVNYGKPTSEQIDWLYKFRALGWSAYWVNSFEEFQELHRTLKNER